VPCAGPVLASQTVPYYSDVALMAVYRHTGGTPVGGYTGEDRDVGTSNLIYVLVVIILILVALLLLAPLL
jgi:hypothetical protein